MREADIHHCGEPNGLGTGHEVAKGGTFRHIRKLSFAKSTLEPSSSDGAVLDASGMREVHDLRIAGTVRLSELLNHLYVLVPVLDNSKHWWIDKEEIEKLLAKGEGWHVDHPEKELITRRALKHRRGCWQTNANRYPIAHESRHSGRAELTPLGESGVAVELEDVPAEEVAFLIEMVVH